MGASSMITEQSISAQKCEYAVPPKSSAKHTMLTIPIKVIWMVQADAAYPYYKMRIDGSTNKNEGVEKKIIFYLNYHKAKHMQTKSFFCLLSSFWSYSKKLQECFESVPEKSGEPLIGICPSRVKALRSDIFLRGGRPVLLN